ncbi:hypothetical protein TNCV_3201051 [Trichonephila clavipes]|nr:hypothetical protein TNCV_3201051 [Trichonephila clavipes]
MRTTPELASLSPNYHTTPTGGRLISQQIERALLPNTAGLQRYQSRTHDTPVTLGRSKKKSNIDRSVAIKSLESTALNSHRAASPLVRLVEGEERWEAPDHLQDVLPQNWGGTEQKHAVTCMELKITTNGMRQYLVPAVINFAGLDLMLLTIRCREREIDSTTCMVRKYKDFQVRPPGVFPRDSILPMQILTSSFHHFTETVQGLLASIWSPTLCNRMSSAHGRLKTWTNWAQDLTLNGSLVSFSTLP